MLGAFDRLEAERAAEIAFLDEVLKPDCSIEALLRQALEIPAAELRDRALFARRVVARRLYEGFSEGGLSEAIARARKHRLRIGLWREPDVPQLA